MKKIILNVTLSIFSINIFSCIGENGAVGMDGQDGDAYIAVSWATGPLYFVTDEPNFTNIFFNGSYYLTQPGTYSFAYEAWDYSQWVGNYTLYINEG